MSNSFICIFHLCRSLLLNSITFKFHTPFEFTLPANFNTCAFQDNCGFQQPRCSAIDSQLTMANHIAVVCHSGFFKLWQLRCIRQSLMPAARKTLVHEFISSRLDYCNQRFVGVQWLAAGQAAVPPECCARLVMGARKFDRITPLMWQLHWLPVQQRLRFKMAFLVFNCLRGLAPVYLVDYCKLTSANTGRSHCDRPICVSCLFHGQVHPTVTGVSPSVDHLRGTVYRQRCD